MSLLRQVLEELIATLPQVYPQGGSGAFLEFPSFDLLPQDYLKFAESHLGKDSPEEKINCVSNLKRAMECEMDTFFHILGIGPLVKRKNLSFDQKLSFVAEIEIYKSRSLEILNRIRNKIEHDYAIPELPEIELYFELVYAFISVLDSAMFMYAHNADLEYSRETRTILVDLKVGYSHEKQQVSFYFSKPQGAELEKGAHSFGVENIKEFAHALSAYFWVVRGSTLFSDQYVEDRLRDIANQL